MSSFQLQDFITAKLKTAVWKIQPVGGGCINQTYKVVTASAQFFCKVNSASKFPQMFEKEKNGLKLLAKQNIIKTPEVISYWVEDNHQILLLEWIEEAVTDNGFWKSFGEQLAALHKVSSETFGLDEDNFMGSVPQSNKQHNNWTSFFIEERLKPLLQLCTDSKLLTTKHLKQFESLYNRLPQIFDTEKPSLLHGDLWNGNFMCIAKAQPVLIDPAVYFGHCAIDLGMTTLFGGFDRSFYDAYNYHFPLSNNYKEQWQTANLYPLLIHLYLFGRSYLYQIEEILKNYQ